MSDLGLVVTDVKQWRYCPRIVFYQKLTPLQPPRTYKMERAKRNEPEHEALEKRRTLKEYDLPAGRRRFRVPLYSERLGMSGRLDLLIEADDALYPVDFKETEGPVRENHGWQLAAYALLLAETDARPTPRGFVHRVPDGEIFPVELPDEFLDTVRAAIGEMSAMVKAERFPPPTFVRARCDECEYRNFCGDVF